MIENKRLLAIIPARGGSKRLPNKNILNLGGKPLLGWSIEAAKKSKYIDSCVVSSEDQKILEVAKDYGLDVTVERPEELAQDESTTVEVVLYHLKEFEKKGIIFDYVVLLQPTSPLRTNYHIDQACAQLIDNNDAESIVSVCEASHHPLWANTIPKNLSMSSFINKEIKNLRSQDLPVYYQLNGAIYICSVEILLQEKTFFPENNCYAYIMQKEVSIDVDTKEDFDLLQIYCDNSILEKANFFDELYDEYIINKSKNLNSESFKNYLSQYINAK